MNMISKELILERITSPEADIRLDMIESIKNAVRNDALEVLLPLLNSSDSLIRDAVALALRELGDSRSFEPLLNAVLDPANRDHRGTLVYALETHNCSKIFLTIIDLALYGNYEVQCHALTILKEQQFEISDKECKEAKAAINKYLDFNDKCEDYELLIKEILRAIDNS